MQSWSFPNDSEITTKDIGICIASQEFATNHNAFKTNQITTKPSAYYTGYTILVMIRMTLLNESAGNLSSAIHELGTKETIFYPKAGMFKSEISQFVISSAFVLINCISYLT